MKTVKIKNKTNGGDPCKQIFIVVDYGQGPALIIRKWVLSSNESLYYDYRLLKRFKGKSLFYQVFSIRIKTLGMVGKFIEDRLKELYK